jgi:bisphosphoglycerate-dependent phosphoglycerate mutase
MNIEKSELENLQEQEKKKGAILHDIGLLSTQIHSLQHMYGELMAEQAKMKDELEEKYGQINVNLNDGSYEVIPEEDEKEEDK